MTKSGKAIGEAIRQVRGVYEHVALLLTTAESLLAPKEWKVFGGGTATANNSASIHNPRQWIPQDTFRFFSHEKRPHLLAFVSVILDDIDDSERVAEPVVSMGWIDYGAGVKVGSQWEYAYARIFLVAENAQPNGEFHHLEPFRFVAENKAAIKGARVCAVPLVDITSAEELHARIIEPFLKSVG